jgi:betaine-aldehyde dehydrogenase
VHQFIAGRRRDGGSGEPSTSTDPRPARPSSRWCWPTPATSTPRSPRPARRSRPGRAPPGRAVRALDPAGRPARRRGRRAGRTETRQTGKPIRLSTGFDVPGTVDNVAFFAGAARTSRARPPGSTPATTPRTSAARPIGVVGSIAPWNYPLQMAALGRSCPRSRRATHRASSPAEMTAADRPLQLAELGQQRRACRTACFNVGSGRGPGRGRGARRPSRGRTVSFHTARRRRAPGHGAWRLGGPQARAPRARGKAPCLVVSTTPTSRQRCTVRWRGLAHHTGSDLHRGDRGPTYSVPLYDAFVAASRRMRSVRARRPVGRADRPGPAGLRAQQERVAGFVDRARRDGAKVVRGGVVPGGRWPAAPTTSRRWSSTPPQAPRSSRTRSSARCSSCCRSTATTRARAGQRHPVRAGRVGLDPRRVPVLRATREIRAGCVWVNDHIPIISEMPHGGYKASGSARTCPRTRSRSTPTSST